MRYFIIFILALACMVSLNFIMPEAAAETANELKISAYVIASDIDDPNMCDENTEYDFELLEPGEVRLMAPTVGAGMWNLNLYFEYDGIIEVITDDVQISVGANARAFYEDEESFKGRMYGYQFHVNDSGHMSFYPCGGCYGYKDLDEKTNPPYKTEDEPGHEYYITVNAYKDSDCEWPTASAILKLTKLKDNHAVLRDTNVSRYYSIELVSYK